MEKDNPFKVDLTKVPKDKIFYSLAMFPYPSGAGLHVGHAMNFTANDVMARFKRMNGYAVLNPIGWDSFGLPTEGYAMKVGKPANEVTEENISNFIAQCKLMDRSYDRDREFATSSPEYYKRTQWLFQELYKAGLVYRKEAFVNRCPKDQTVLANDQVVNGACERCGTEVVQKKHMQWFVKITDYAERLINDLDTVDWPEETKTQQKYWIGKSEGAEIDFTIAESNNTNITVFTTRPDTIYGVTAIVLAPENETIDSLLTEEYKSKLDEYRKATGKKTNLERQQDAEERSGMFSGLYVIHPLTNEQIPVWFADYVLPDYATGAVMFVPAHDQRDYEFWFANGDLKYNSPLKHVIHPNSKDDILGDYFPAYAWSIQEGETPEDAKKKALNINFDEILKGNLGYSGDGVLVNSAQFNGMQNIEAKKAIIDHLEKNGLGKRKITYKLRDWSISRQRYWGCPIPFYYTFAENIKVPFYSSRDYYPESVGNWLQPDKPISIRTNAKIIIKHRSEDKYLLLKNDTFGYHLVGGGIDEGESIMAAAIREAKEETQYENFEVLKELNGFEIHSDFYQPLKKQNRYLIEKFIVLQCKDDETSDTKLEDHEAFEYHWVDADKVGELINYPNEKHGWYVYYDTSKIPEHKTTDMYNAYNPHPDKSKWVPNLIPEEELPVVLPLDLGDYKPAGKSPLADHPTFPYYKAKDGKTYLRECDTLDTFIDSSFYFLRFIDPKNYKELISKELAEKALPVDFYMGGKEHTYGHLLYSRFINKFLYDQGYLKNSEPFQKLFHQGFVLGPDGRKMSKRWGNIVNPSEVADEVGSDATRTYTMFMGPLEMEKVWNPQALAGVKKFIERVERLEQFISHEATAIDASLHKTIKGVTEDIERIKFNTAVSKLMVFVNDVYDKKAITTEQLSTFLQLLAPFATRLSQEMRTKLGNKENIHFSQWPSFDPAKIAEDVIKLPVQINGKMKGTLEVAAGISQEEVIEQIKADEKLASNVEGKEIAKVIFVQDKIINIIVK